LAHAIKRRLQFGNQLPAFQEKDELWDFQTGEAITFRYVNKAPVIRENMIDSVRLRHGDDLPVGL
jgi:hypothetical protein